MICDYCGLTRRKEEIDYLKMHIDGEWVSRQLCESCMNHIKEYIDWRRK